MENIEDISSILKAISDPTRIKILIPAESIVSAMNQRIRQYKRNMGLMVDRTSFVFSLIVKKRMSDIVTTLRRIKISNFFRFFDNFIICLCIIQVLS